MILLHQGRNPVAPANLTGGREARSFESMGAAEYWTPNLLGGDAPTKLWALRLTPEGLPMLGVRPMLGRLFFPSEGRAGADRVAVIGDGLWRRRFGSDPAVLGKLLSLDGEPYTIVGVMPPGFRFAPFWATQAELWVPLDLAPRSARRDASSLRVFARLAKGVSLTAARQEIAAVTGALEREFPGTNREVRVVPLQEKVVGDVRPILLVLVGAVALVLLLACANVANMLLARSSARRKEMALRAAIGASRARTLRQLLTESLVLAAAGGAAGVGLGIWALRLLVALAPPETPRLADVRLDPAILLATLSASVLTGLVFGLAPALQGSATRLQDALKEGGSAGTGRETGWLRRVLVAAEVAIALVLLVGAGLMVRASSPSRRSTRDSIRAESSRWRSPWPGPGAEPGRRLVLYPEIRERLRALPGVRAAGAINHLPIAGDIWGFPYRIEGRPTPRPGESPVATYRAVLPGYFAAMRLPILRGRDVAAADGPSSPGVVVINEYLAKRVWPGEDPIGKRIDFDGTDANPSWVTVIGVVKNAVREEWSEPPEDEVYLSALQRRALIESPHTQEAYLTFVARVDGDAAALAPSLRAAVAGIDRTLPVSEVQTMEHVVSLANARPRFQTLLLGSSPRSPRRWPRGHLRRDELRRLAAHPGDRRADGARRGIAAGPAAGRGQAMGVAAAGAAAGLAEAFLLTRLMRSVLYGVGPSDPHLRRGRCAPAFHRARGELRPARRAAHRPGRGAAPGRPQTAHRGRRGSGEPASLDHYQNVLAKVPDCQGQPSGSRSSPGVDSETCSLQDA